MDQSFDNIPRGCLEEPELIHVNGLCLLACRVLRLITYLSNKQLPHIT